MRRTARHRILDYLREHPGASAAQVGRGLNMRPASVRFHLGVLLADGRVASVGVERSIRRGRPSKTYRLSETQRGHNLAGLLIGVLRWLEGQPDSRKQAAYEAVAVELAKQIGPGNPGVFGPRRLAAVVSALDAFHYEAAWEAGAEGPRVLLGHCPFAAVIDAHPALCQVDARMLSMQMGAEAVQTAKIGASPGGSSHCVFAIR